MNEPNQFACTFEEFKRLCKDFHDALPTLKSNEEIDGGWHCIGLSYLNMIEQCWQTSAAVLLKMISVEVIDARIRLKSKS